jgi:hypothetical protein
MSGQHFLPVPASLSHLDLGDIQAALIDTHANVYSAASALGVPAADLRRLTRAHPQLIDIAIEAVEQRLDLAERNLDEALHSDDRRRRDAASYFIIKNTVRSKQRGWIPSSAASVDVALAADLPPRRIVVSWRNPGDDEPDKPDESDDDGWETFERDGQTIRVPRYDGARRDDDIEGELSLPATMLEHAAAVEPEPAPVVPDPAPPGPDPAVRYERERIDAWIRNRIVNYPTASRLLCRKPIAPGAAWRKFRTARPGRVFIGVATRNGGLSRKRRRDRGWGSRAEPSRSERTRRRRGADVASARSRR